VRGAFFLAAAVLALVVGLSDGIDVYDAIRLLRVLGHLTG
jgi:hypothetical protein